MVYCRRRREVPTGSGWGHRSSMHRQPWRHCLTKYSNSAGGVRKCGKRGRRGTRCYACGARGATRPAPVVACKAIASLRASPLPQGFGAMCSRMVIDRGCDFSPYLCAQLVGVSPKPEVILWQSSDWDLDFSFNWPARRAFHHAGFKPFRTGRHNPVAHQFLAGESFSLLRHRRPARRGIQFVRRCNAFRRIKSLRTHRRLRAVLQLKDKHRRRARCRAKRNSARRDNCSCGFSSRYKSPSCVTSRICL